MPDVEVTQHEAQHRFELQADSHTAFLTYRIQPGEITLVHTEVPKELEGRGIGGKLAQAAFQYAREHHLLVNPLCPFVAGYLQRHPEFSDLLRK